MTTVNQVVARKNLLLQKARDIALILGLAQDDNVNCYVYLNPEQSIMISAQLDSPQVWVSVKTAEILDEEWTSVLDNAIDNSLESYRTWIKPDGCPMSWMDLLESIHAQIPQDLPTQKHHLNNLEFLAKLIGTDARTTQMLIEDLRTLRNMGFRSADWALLVLQKLLTTPEFNRQLVLDLVEPSSPPDF